MGAGEDDADLANASPLVESETLIRRVLPDGIVERPGIGWTAQSGALRATDDDPYPSWSLLRVTSPQRLIEIESMRRDTRGWHVVAISIGQLAALGITVVTDPTEEDPGHCILKPADAEPFKGKSIWKKVAERTRVVYTHPS